MIASLTRYTYAKVFEILIYGLYLSKNKQLNAISNQIFKETVQDCYDQGKRDLKQPTSKLKWAFILPLLMMPDLNMSYESYLEALGQTSAQETYKRIIEHIKMRLDVTMDVLKQLLRKQINRILNVNRGKYSGVMVEVARGAGNKGYIGADEGKDQLIKFVAEIDDVTTEMCRSLDGQIFHTRAWNRFTRYSDYYKGLHTFNCFGLEQGLNLPPINDHFHWCRSVVTFQTDDPKMDYLAEFNQMRRLIPEYLPETFEEYASRCENDESYHIHMKELESLKKHFNKEYLRNEGNFQNQRTREKLRHISFDSYQSGYFEDRNTLQGTICSNGMEINDLRYHAYDRMLERDIDIDMIVDVLENGITKSYLKDPNITDFVKDSAEIGVSANGAITTCIKKGT